MTQGNNVSISLYLHEVYHLDQERSSTRHDQRREGHHNLRRAVSARVIIPAGALTGYDRDWKNATTRSRDRLRDHTRVVEVRWGNGARGGARGSRARDREFIGIEGLAVRAGDDIDGDGAVRAKDRGLAAGACDNTHWFWPVGGDDDGNFAPVRTGNDEHGDCSRARIRTSGARGSRAWRA